MRSTVILLVAASGILLAGEANLRGQRADDASASAVSAAPVRVLEGRFTTDLELAPGADWVLRGEVFVAAPARVIVQNGARVVSDPATAGTLLIEQGAELVVISGGIVNAPVLTHVELVLQDDTRGAAAPVLQPALTTSAAQSLERAAARTGGLVAAPGYRSRTLNASDTTAAATRLVRSTASVPTGTVRRPGGAPKAVSLYTGAFPLAPSPTGRSAVRRTSGALSSAVTGAVNTGTPAATAPETESTLQAVGPPNTVPGLDKPVRVIHGRFTSDLTLTNDTYWVLRGAVFIGAPAKITIQPGTRIVGELATTGTLIIERGAQIIADGTKDQPIVFTSDQPIGLRGRGDWGGVIINGNAPVNLAGGVGIGEGNTGIYGGSDPDDNSGIVRYVRVEFAGVEFSPDNELNGIAFQGVGRGTTVEYVQVHFNRDDGLEWFGGTVDVKYALVTGAGDDSFDWTFGWQGRGQFLIAQQRGDDADRGFESDNQANNNELLPRSKPTIYNFTLIGDPDTNEGTQSTQGMELREGTAGMLRNFIVTGFKLQAFRVTGASSAAQTAAGELSARHGIVFGNGTNLHSSAAALVAAAGGTINVVDPQLIAPFDLANPNFRPAPGSPALTLGFETPPNDGFFDTTVTYRGALSADLSADWTQGWTTYAQN